MPRKAEPTNEKPSGSRWTTIFVTLVFGVGILASIIFLGRFAAKNIGNRDRYLLPISAIDCAIPEWVNQDEFWAEVRYLGNLAEEFQPIDDAEVNQVRDAISKHPWVEFVADDGYLTVAKRYNLTVGFRRPVLVIASRTVDRNGILLPRHKPMEFLTRLLGPFPEPVVEPGTVWDHPTIVRAAELATRYDAQSIERTDNSWRITLRNGTPIVLDR